MEEQRRAREVKRHLYRTGKMTLNIFKWPSKQVWHARFTRFGLIAVGFLTPDRIRAHPGGEAQLHEQRRRGFLWCLGML